jgi:DMSO/TMAO reductase YedYZ molybdopterin-dependent catalytic subunit
MLSGARWQTDRVPERELNVLSEEPLNAETKLDLQRGTIVPAGRHYVRTHFGIPDGPREIRISGGEGAAKTLTLDEVRSLPRRAVVVTLECAGNGRRFLDPPTPGEQWGLGAVGTAEWAGTPLGSVLETSPGDSVEVLFRGADEGTPKDLGRRIAYERSLPVEVARGDDVLIAYEMNGQPIPREHGGPLRLIVPSWYGMASVKWLAEISLISRPFGGFFQKDRYVIDGRPLRRLEPRAVIAAPADGSEVRAGAEIEVRGFAWSGRAPIERVDLTDRGQPIASTAIPETHRYAWSEFTFSVSLDPGEHVLIARAVDRDGNTQPLAAKWNALGYANNSAQPARIKARS